MAIKVVQGLIDVSRPDPQRTGTNASTSESPRQTNSATPVQSSATPQDIATLSQAASRAVASSDASISNVRSRPGGEVPKIQDSHEAQEVADSLAERISEDEDEALEAHQVTSSSARPHLTH